MRLPLRDLLIAAILIYTTVPIGARAQERELGPDVRACIPRSNRNFCRSRATSSCGCRLTFLFRREGT